jgi:lysophospholipase L1-like esterase
LKQTLFVFAISLLSFKFLDENEKNIFVLGDSISIQYGPLLKEALKGILSYDRLKDNGQSEIDLDKPVGANGGDSKRVLQSLESIIANGEFGYKYLLLNCGLHDIKTDPKTGKMQVPIEEYKINLSKVVSLQSKLKTKIIWVKTTPVVDSIHNARSGFHRHATQVDAYNKAADSIMKKHRIPIIDLFKFTNKFIPQGYIDHVHFNNEVRKQQADFIAESIAKIIKKY